MESHHTSHDLSPEQLEAIERLFRVDLAPAPIDLEKYWVMCESNETAQELLSEMIAKCLDYVVDVSNMERYTIEHPGLRDEDFDTVDQRRKITHDAMISSVNIFSRYILKNNLADESFITWDSSSRPAYGRFAILTTLNIFKDKILVDLVSKRSGGEIDTNKLRETADKQELMVLDYVDILCGAENEDRVLTDGEMEALLDIEQKLGQTQDKILGAFHTIYIRRY